MRDDTDKVGLPASARRYARLTSRDKAAYGPAKVDLYIKAQGDLSHQSTKGFPHSSGGHSLGKAVKGAKGGFPNIAGTGTVPHAMKETAVCIVDYLLEMDFNQEPEGIRAAATKTHRGNIFTGITHWESCAKASQAGEQWSDEDLGFVTTTGRFVDRNEAEMIGAQTGQLQKTIEDPSMVHAREFTHYL